MIYSDHYKVAGIGIPKTATRSLASSIKMNFVAVSPLHKTALEVSQDMAERGKAWDDYYTFTIVRNPWERYWSFYNFLVGNSKNQHNKKRVFPAKAVFKSFLTQMSSQDSFFLDKDGNVMVDHLGDFKNLDSEFSLLCEKMGVEGRCLQHINKSEPVCSWDELFDDDIIGIISEKESCVIDLMGYVYGR